MSVDDWSGSRSYRPCSITIATPGVISSDSHGLVKNDKVVFTTTGALPTGITADTYYFVIEGTYSDGTVDPDTFKIASSLNGNAITTSGSQSGAQFFSSSVYKRMTPAYEDNH